MIKISVVIPARNEASNIEQVVSAVKRQTIQPQKIIVVNDNSTDNTVTIAQSLGCTVKHYPHKHDNWLARKELANIINLGLSEVFNDDLHYIMILGADHILPENYIEKIIERMCVSGHVIASGVIDGEYSNTPRGSGRVVDYKWWKDLGLVYPVNYGYESWLCLKALSVGHSIKVYTDIITTAKRTTSTNYRPRVYYYYGLAMSSLNYHTFYVLFKAVILCKKRKWIGGLCLIMGYLLSNQPRYEDIRQYVHNTHAYTINNILRLKIHHIRDLWARFRSA